MSNKIVEIKQKPGVKSVTDKIDDFLGLSTMPQEALVPEIVPPAEIVKSGDADEDMDADILAVRQGLHDLVKKSQNLSDKAAFFAIERQDPKSIEAAVSAQKEARDSLLAVLELHRARKEMERSTSKSPAVQGDTTINQTVYYGTTAEILKMMKAPKEEDPK